MNQLQMLKMALIAYVNSAKAIWSAIAHPLSIISKKATMLKDYRIYGNSVQDGEPTPENPIEVQSVGELTTKNIFDIDACLNECLTKNDDGTYTLKRTESNRFTDWATVYIPIDTKYAKGFDIVEKNRPSYSSDAIGVQYKYEDGTEGTGILYANNIGTATGGHHVSTVPKNVVAVRFYMDWSEAVGDYITFKNAQIEIGDTTTKYEPYHKYKVPVTVRGKNLFGYIKGQWANITLVEALASGDIVAGNSASDHVNSYASGWYRPGNTNSGGICPILHTGDIVTVSADITLIELRRDTEYKPSIYVFSQEANDGHTSNGTTPINVGETVRISRTYTIAEKYDGDAFYPIIPVNGNVVKIENMQIAYGTDSQYEPYIEPQTHNIYLDEPLRKIGEYADYVDFEKGVVVREIRNRKISSISGWESQSVTSGFNRWETHFASDKLFTNTNTENVICSGLITSRYDSHLNDSISERSNMNRLRILSDRFSTTDEMLEAFGDFDIHYVLAAPTEQPISLPNLPQFKGTTVYEVQQDIPPSGIEVCYYE